MLRCEIFTGPGAFGKCATVHVNTKGDQQISAETWPLRMASGRQTGREMQSRIGRISLAPALEGSRLPGHSSTVTPGAFVRSQGSKIK
jgi:hypothetical protein